MVPKEEFGYHRTFIVPVRPSIIQDMFFMAPQIVLTERNHFNLFDRLFSSKQGMDKTKSTMLPNAGFHIQSTVGSGIGVIFYVFTVDPAI